jgi:hypothetical protein
MSEKNANYWKGFHEEQSRQAAKRERGFSVDAAEIAKNLRRDEHRKQNILAHFPQVGHSMDAGELAQASAIEIASRALQSAGIKVAADSDPVEAVEFYIAGRAGAPSERHWHSYSGAVMDGSDVGGTDFVSKYINGT